METLLRAADAEWRWQRASFQHRASSCRFQARVKTELKAFYLSLNRYFQRSDWSSADESSLAEKHKAHFIPELSAAPVWSREQRGSAGSSPPPGGCWAKGRRKNGRSWAQLQLAANTTDVRAFLITTNTALFLKVQCRGTHVKTSARKQNQTHNKLKRNKQRSTSKAQMHSKMTPCP